jgi:hypothetical protein
MFEVEQRFQEEETIAKGGGADADAEIDPPVARRRALTPPAPLSHRTPDRRERGEEDNSKAKEPGKAPSVFLSPPLPAGAGGRWERRGRGGEGPAAANAVGWGSEVVGRSSVEKTVLVFEKLLEHLPIHL